MTLPDLFVEVLDLIAQRRLGVGTVRIKDVQLFAVNQTAVTTFLKRMMP